jgi:hypothetical protein
MKKIAYLSFLATFIINYAFAERMPATITTTSGETINATLDLPDNDAKLFTLAESIEYYDAGGSKQSLKTDLIKEITFNHNSENVRLVSIPYRHTGYTDPLPGDHENILMELLVDGKVSVYKYYYKEPAGQFAGALKEKYLLKNESGEFYEPPYLTFRKDMAGYLCDCPVLIDKIEDGKYKRKQLTELIAEYNQTCGY